MPFGQISDFFFRIALGFHKDKISKMLEGSVGYVKRGALRRWLQKYTTLINIIIFDRIKTQKSKRGFGFLVIKGSIFSKMEKSYILYSSKHFLFFVFAQKGVFNFRNPKITADSDQISFFLRIPKRWRYLKSKHQKYTKKKGGGCRCHCPGSTMYRVLTCMYVYTLYRPPNSQLSFRAGKPANFWTAPAPATDFFSSGSGFWFFPSGSGSWYFFFEWLQLRLQGTNKIFF